MPATIFWSYLKINGSMSTTDFCEIKKNLLLSPRRMSGKLYTEQNYFYDMGQVVSFGKFTLKLISRNQEFFFTVCGTQLPIDYLHCELKILILSKSEVFSTNLKTMAELFDFKKISSCQSEAQNTFKTNKLYPYLMEG